MQVQILSGALMPKIGVNHGNPADAGKVVGTLLVFFVIVLILSIFPKVDKTHQVPTTSVCSVPASAR